LQSIEKQTYNNYEVIIIDDGSTDNSVKVIKSFIKDKSKFVLIQKENGGVSSARNRGIAEATGEWIAFIDSDDYVQENYILGMINGLMEYPADFCMAGFRKYFEDTLEFRDSLMTISEYGLLAETLDFLFFPSPFARLYSAQIIKRNNILFDERIFCGEDRAFNFDYLCYVERCVIVNNNFYVYRIRSGSVTNKRVLPAKKRHLYEHAKKFWMSFENESIIREAFKRNHHLAHNILDSFLADVINAILENNRMMFENLVNDPISREIVAHYKHKSAPKKEKLLVALLYRRHFLLCKMVIKLYYNGHLHKLIKPIVKALR
jgi:glycosyltransferase involved in cell wall biosynthesis